MGQKEKSILYCFSSCMLNPADLGMRVTNLFTVESDYRSEEITTCKPSRRFPACFRKVKLLSSIKLQKDCRAFLLKQTWKSGTVKVSCVSCFPSMPEHFYLMIILQIIISAVL